MEPGFFRLLLIRHGDVEANPGGVIDSGPQPVVRLVDGHVNLSFANARWLERR